MSTSETEAIGCILGNGRLELLSLYETIDALERLFQRSADATLIDSE